MTITLRFLSASLALGCCLSTPATAQSASPIFTPGALTADQRVAHDVYKELIEINSSVTTGNITTAAVAMAKRFRGDTGFPALTPGNQIKDWAIM